MTAVAVPVPDVLAEWASEVASLNLDIQEDTLLATSRTFGPNGDDFSLYGGMAPVGPHVDAEADDTRIHEIWGLILTDVDGGVVVGHGPDQPVRRGSFYRVDPRVEHRLDCAGRRHLCFVGTWGYDAEARFGTPEAFALAAVAAVDAERSAHPDAARYMELQAHLEEGELS